MSSYGAKLTRLMTLENLLLLFAAGAVGELAVEIIAWWVFPPLLGMPMRPHILVTDLGRALLGANFSVTLAVSIHMALGLIIFPVVFVAGRDMLGAKGTLVPGIVFGVILWLIAQTTLAPLAGRPFMLGFIPYTWGSLFAHVGYTVAVAWAYDRLAGRSGGG